MKWMRRMIIMFGLVALEAGAETLVRKHLHGHVVAEGMERIKPLLNSIEVDADGNVELSTHLVDSTRNPSPSLVRKHQASTTGQIAADGSVTISNGFVDSMPQLSPSIVRKASEGQVATDSSPELEGVSEEALSLGQGGTMSTISAIDYFGGSDNVVRKASITTGGVPEEAFKAEDDGRMRARSSNDTFVGSDNFVRKAAVLQSKVNFAPLEHTWGVERLKSIMMAKLNSVFSAEAASKEILLVADLWLAIVFLISSVTVLLTFRLLLWVTSEGDEDGEVTGIRAHRASKSLLAKPQTEERKSDQW